MTKKVAVNKKKVAIYLLVLCVIGLLYWAYASVPSTEEIEKTQSSKVMTYHNNSIKEEVEGKLVWQCYAETMSVDQETEIVSMENVKGIFYREDGSEIELTATKGTYNQKEKNMIFENGIQAKSTDKTEFSTDKIIWNGQDSVLTCEGNVRISKPNVIATADKAESKDAFQNFKLIGKAHIIKGE